MKSVMISIQPKWCELIASGEKTIEVRKTKPKIETPFKCYIYATKPKKWFRFSSWGSASDENLWLSNGKVKMCDGFEFWADGKEYEPLCGKVIGEFVCDDIDTVRVFNDILYCVKNSQANKLGQMCLTIEEIKAYLGENHGYNWHISDLVIYDKPKEISEFRVPCKFAYSSYEKGICYEDCIQGRLEDCRNFCLPLTRPPQSWQYVEEKENEK